MATCEKNVVSLPPHLARYAVDQDYASYTPRDHAVWRHILHRLTGHLKEKAHPSYLEGLAATGIGVERIPSLAEMNEKLAVLGWSAMAVRGFIPPPVFTELQARGILAIAADIRSHEHVEYTPAPDIVHESAGHAPILKDPRYAAYLKRCGVAGFKAIASREDREVFEAVRRLSVVKEDPAATPDDLALAGERLEAAQAGRTYVSESAKASRLYWWTAEYGLVGTLDRPRLYGAGLLSSLGEASHCLTPEVTRRPLSLACVDQDFDITRMQPQLFVARDFDHLFEVLEAFEATLAWKRGGDYGLEEAARAGTVNHLLLADGRELTGRVACLVRAAPELGSVGSADPDQPMKTLLALVEGPVLLSRGGAATMAAPWSGPAVVVFGTDPGPGPFHCRLPGGLILAGIRGGGEAAEGLEGSLGGQRLDLPPSALLVFSESLPGVAGGPGDPGTWDRWFGEPELRTGAGEALARRRKAEALPAWLGELYLEVARMRQSGRIDPGRLRRIRERLDRYPGDWLLACEVGELLGEPGT